MKLIARGMAFALVLAPALAHADEKSTTKSPTSKDAARTDANPMNTPDIGERGKTSSAADEKMSDARLIAVLHHVNQDEIAAGKLAQQKGQSAEIKQYGRQLIDDHTKSDADVKAAAKKAGISMSESALTKHDKEMMRVDKNKMDQLKKLSGAEFDRTFAQVLAKDHDHMISMLRDHKDDLKSADLKQLVDNTLPVLERHKDMAEKAERNFQAKAGTGTTQGRSPAARDRSPTAPRTLPENATPSTTDKSTTSAPDKK
jgi:putative membrane protein